MEFLIQRVQLFARLLIHRTILPLRKGSFGFLDSSLIPILQSLKLPDNLTGTKVVPCFNLDFYNCC